MAKGVVFANRPTEALVARAQMALGMSHRTFGEALGVSQRTAQRWASHGANLSVAQLQTLAALVHPEDPTLAAELAESTSETLVSLGIAAPPGPPPAPSPRANAAGLAEAVVCAAADEMAVVPSQLRSTLLVAFRTARELGLTVEDVERALAARMSVKPAKP
jgi:hypothetical protein